MSYSFSMQSSLRSIHHYFIVCWTKSYGLGWPLKQYFLGCNSHKHVFRIKYKNVTSSGSSPCFSVVSKLMYCACISCRSLCHFQHNTCNIMQSSQLLLAMISRWYSIFYYCTKFLLKCL